MPLSDIFLGGGFFYSDLFDADRVCDRCQVTETQTLSVCACPEHSEWEAADSGKIAQHREIIIILFFVTLIFLINYV